MLKLNWKPIYWLHLQSYTPSDYSYIIARWGNFHTRDSIVSRKPAQKFLALGIDWSRSLTLRCKWEYWRLRPQPARSSTRATSAILYLRGIWYLIFESFYWWILFNCSCSSHLSQSTYRKYLSPVLLRRFRLVISQMLLGSLLFLLVRCWHLKTFIDGTDFVWHLVYK